MRAAADSGNAASRPKIGLVAVGRALETDPEPGVVLPDSQPDVDEQQALRAALDAVTRRGGHVDTDIRQVCRESGGA